MTLLPTTNSPPSSPTLSETSIFSSPQRLASFLRPKLSSVVLLLSCGVFGALMYGVVQIGDICPDDGAQPCRWYEFSEILENRRKTLSPDRSEGEKGRAREDCSAFPNTNNVLLVMKTGASEAWNKIPTQLNTNMRCKVDFLIFSDTYQIINNVPVHDSLDTVLPQVTEDNPDFDLYRRQKLCPIDQETCNKEVNVAEQAWALDKYKNIHVAEKAWALKPGYDWYMFVDADSYVVWPTLMDWLGRIDAQTKIYMGSVAMLRDMPFAHGGSGYLASKGLMEAMFGGKAGVANRYDDAATRTCCGDALFSHAVKNETGVDVVNVWPTVNGEKAGTLEYGPKQWCQPLVTMHHIGSQEVSEFDALERSRDYASPVRIKDVFDAFIRPNLTSFRPEWDNQSDEIHLVDRSTPRETYSWVDSRKVRNPAGLSEYQQRAHLSPSACRLACKSLGDCLQWRYYSGVCSLSSTVRMGRPRALNLEHRLTSGWEMERIEAWAKAREDCGDVVWPEVG